TGKFVGIHVERTRVDELFDDVLEDYKLNRHTSIVETTSRLNNHLRPFFGGKRAANVSTSDIQRYIRTRLDAEASHATINRELEILKRAFTLGATCDPPKVARQLRISKLEEKNIRTGFLDDAEYLRLKQELPEYLRPLFIVAYHVGNRLGELRKLK